MDVTGVSSGAVGPDRPPLARGAQLSPAAGAGAISVDAIGGMFRELSPSDLSNLLKVVEQALPAAPVAASEALLQNAGSALAAGHPGRALEHLRQLIAVDPQRGESLPSSPAFSSIRVQVEKLLSEVSGPAKLHAQSRLSEAARLGDQAPSGQTELNVPVLLEVATQLIKAGGLSNYVRSAGVSEKVIESGCWAPGIKSETVSSPVMATSRVRFSSLTLLWLSLGAAVFAISWLVSWDGAATLLRIWVAGFLAIGVGAAWRSS